MQYDLKNYSDRLNGSRSLKTAHNRVIVYILVGIIILIGFVVSLQLQTYWISKSAEVSKAELVAKFYPLPEVPTMHITFK